MKRKITAQEGRLGGNPFLEGARIGVSGVGVKYEGLGYGVEELVEAYPRTNRADIHSALAYFYSHQEEMSDAAETPSAGAEA